MTRRADGKRKPDPVEVAIATAANLTRDIVKENGWGVISIVIRNGVADQVKIDRAMRVADLVKAA